MPEIDPVILQLRADVDKYQADVRRATRTVDDQLGLQEKRVKSLEAEMRASSNKIGSSLKRLAGTLGVAFTGRELMGLLDSFTRLQNNLRVAGVAGENMKAVQDRLFQSAQRYGVELEGLSSLFSAVTQASKELGASQEQVFGLTDAVSASLKITGLSAQEAQGALLQLGQALRSGTVQAEEYNSLLDGLYPLLEAAANGSDRWGGSVAKLTADVKASKVTSQEFFNAILAGSDMLEGKASQATLTLSAGFTTLTNALTVYFGEADKANGVSAALGETLAALADNLDTIIPALAAIAVGLGVGFVANAIRARVAAVALAEGLDIASASGLALGMSIKRAGVSILSAFGGPVGVAITGVALAFFYTEQQASNAAAAINEATTAAAGAEAKAETLRKRLADAGVATDGLGTFASSTAGKVDGLAGSMGRAIGQALGLANALQKLEVVKIGTRLAEINRQRQQAINEVGKPSLVDTAIGVLNPAAGAQLLKDRAVGAAGTIAGLNREQAALEQQLSYYEAASKAGVSIAGPDGGGAPAAPGKPKKPPKGRTGSGASGPSTADIEQRFQDERASLMQQYNSAMQSQAKSAEAAAEYELRNVELSRIRTIASIEADKDYSDAQKARLKEQVEELADAERARIEFQKRVDLEREAQDLADERYQSEQDGLRLQLDLAETQDQRKAIALQILDAEDRYLKSKLEAVLASETATEAEKARARIALQALDAQAGARREGVDRQYQGALAKYASDAKDAKTRVEEAAARRIADLNQTIADTMTKALGIKDPFLSQLLQIFLDQNLFGPIADALSRRSSGGGGIFGTILKAVGVVSSAVSGSGGFGNGNNVTGGILRTRASGGSALAGQLYRVNEGASPGRVEGFIPAGSGEIVPLGRMNAARGPAQAGGTVRLIIEEAEGFASRVRAEATGVAIEVQKQSAPAVINAAVSETFRRSNRPRL